MAHLATEMKEFEAALTARPTKGRQVLEEVGELVAILEMSALGGSMLKGVELESDSRRSLRRRHAALEALVISYACGGLVEASSKLRKRGLHLEAESVDGLHLEASSPGAALEKVVYELEILAKVLPSPHQSDAWRGISCAALSLKQLAPLKESSRRLESYLDSASSAAGKAVTAYSHISGGIEMAARLLKIRSGLFHPEASNLSTISTELGKILSEQAYREELGEAVDTTRLMQTWVQRAVKERAVIQASLEEAARVELQRRGELDRDLPETQTELLPGFPNTWRPELDIREEDRLEKMPEVSMGELTWKLEEEVEQLRHGKRSLEEHIRRALMEAGEREAELGALQEELRRKKLHIGDMRQLMLRVVSMVGEKRFQTASKSEREAWEAEMADLSEHAKLLCAYLTPDGDSPQQSHHGHPSMPYPLVDSIIRGAHTKGTDGSQAPVEKEIHHPQEAMIRSKLVTSASKAGLPPLGLTVPPNVSILCNTHFASHATPPENEPKGERKLRKTAQVTVLCAVLVDKLEIGISEIEVKKRARMALRDNLERDPMSSSEFTNWFVELFIDFDPNFEHFEPWKG